MKLVDILEARYADDRRFDCPECDGKGRERIVIQTGEDDFDIDWEPCYYCNGEGKVSRNKSLREAKYQADFKGDVGVAYVLYKKLAAELYQSRLTPVSDASARTTKKGISLDVVMRRDIKVNQAFDYLKQTMKKEDLPYSRIRQHDLANKSKNDRYFEVQYDFK